MEALLNHLQATLAIDWQNPPIAIAPILTAACTVPWRENQHHEIYLTEIDTPLHRDHQREKAYQQALSQVRNLADAQAILHWNLLTEIQEIVLQQSISFRQGDAYVKLDRYAWFPGLESMFCRKIAADARSEVNSIAKAVRLYLDIIFFHPFPDGNARAARLWFEFVLRRDRVNLPSLTALARLRKIPGSSHRYWAFAILAAKLILSDS